MVYIFLQICFKMKIHLSNENVTFPTNVLYYI